MRDISNNLTIFDGKKANGKTERSGNPGEAVSHGTLDANLPSEIENLSVPKISLWLYRIAYTDTDTDWSD